jgi:hypothetical protein
MRKNNGIWHRKKPFSFGMLGLPTNAHAHSFDMMSTTWQQIVSIWACCWRRHDGQEPPRPMLRARRPMPYSPSTNDALGSWEMRTTVKKHSKVQICRLEQHETAIPWLRSGESPPFPFWRLHAQCSCQLHSCCHIYRCLYPQKTSTLPWQNNTTTKKFQ